MNTREVFAVERSPAIEALQAFVNCRTTQSLSGPEAWEGFERELRERVAALEREILRRRMQQEDVDDPHVTIDGVQHRRVTRSPSTYQTVAGPIVVERSLYRPCRAGSAKAVCPLELRVGIVAGEYTPWAARQMATVVAATCSREAEEIFHEMGVFRPSRSNLDRLPKVLSTRWESHRVTWERELRESETIPIEASVVAVQLDGVLIPSRERTGSAEKSSRGGGPLHYREVGCGAVALYDDEGERLHTIRYGRAPEANKEALKEQLDAELGCILPNREDLHLVLLSDGAEDHWTFLEGLAACWEQPGKVTLLVDYWHAAQHLKRAADLRHGEKTVQAKASFEKLKVILKKHPHGVHKVIRSLVAMRRGVPHSKRKALEVEIQYFRNHRSRMGYAAARRKKLPIGSGVVEATCKTLATQRLKRSGMRWSNAGAQAILTLRALQQTDGDRWDRAWRLITSSFHAQVETLTDRECA